MSDCQEQSLSESYGVLALPQALKEGLAFEKNSWRLPAK